MNKIIFSYDLEEMGLLPPNWYDNVKHIADLHSYRVFLDSKSSTSREPENSKGVVLSMVDGNVIKSKLEWLYKLYKNELLELANESTKGKYSIAMNEKIGVNINYLSGEGSRYEWHVDSNPLTGLLFVTTHPKGSGGDLVFKIGNKEKRIYPKRGTFLLFDAREIPHAVMPLIKNDYRISIPFNFYEADKSQERPKDLDSCLYNESTITQNVPIFNKYNPLSSMNYDSKSLEIQGEKILSYIKHFWNTCIAQLSN